MDGEHNNNSTQVNCIHAETIWNFEKGERSFLWVYRRREKYHQWNLDVTVFAILFVEHFQYLLELIIFHYQLIVLEMQANRNAHRNIRDGGRSAWYHFITLVVSLLVSRDLFRKSSTTADHFSIPSRLLRNILNNCRKIGYKIRSKANIEGKHCFKPTDWLYNNLEKYQYEFEIKSITRRITLKFLSPHLFILELLRLNLD